MAKFKPGKIINKNEKIVISVRLSSKKLEELDKIAVKTDISRNQLINQCIDYAIDNIDFKEKNTLQKNRNNNLN